MAIIPSSTRFVGIAPSVNLTEKKSNQLNSETQPYTMQDFQDSISPDLSPIVVDGNSVGIDADPTVTLQQVAVIESLTTNAGIVLKPNGTGAIMAQVPDGTAAGGNARGAYSVDLQMSRDSADKVTNGINSVIVGGLRNKTTGKNSIVVGGESNTTGNRNSVTIVGGESNSNSGGLSFIGAGLSNTITDMASGYAVITGGANNTASSSFSTISGGQSNTASTHSHATVVGGSTNTASGQYSVAGGWLSVASGNYSVVLGRENIGSANYSYIIGRANTANVGGFVLGTYNTNNAVECSILGNACANTSAAQYSTTLGGQSLSYLRGQLTNSSGYIANIGDAQQSTLVSRKQDTLSSAATTVLSLDGTGTTNLIIPHGNYRTWNVTVKWVAVVTSITGTATGVSVGDTIMQVDTFGFKKIGGTSSMVGSANTLSTNNDTSMATAAMGYTAGTSQELKLTFTAPTFTGGGSVTCRVVAKVELTEVAY